MIFSLILPYERLTGRLTIHQPKYQSTTPKKRQIYIMKLHPHTVCPQKNYNRTFRINNFKSFK